MLRAFWSRIVAQRVDLGNHFALTNGLNSVQQIDAEKVEKMTPKWIDDNEQMNSKRIEMN